MKAALGRVALFRLRAAPLESRLANPCNFPFDHTHPSTCTHFRLPPNFNRPQARTRPYARTSEDRTFHQLQPVQAQAEITMAGLSSASSGTKRKRTIPTFYAVKTGYTPGIYQSWEDAKAQTSGFKNPIFKKFTLYTEAEEFMKGEGASASASADAPKATRSKYYGVQAGHTPGVYTDWPAVLEQVTGFKRAKQKRFDTWEEAQAYVNEAQYGAFSQTNTSTPISVNGQFNSTTPSAVESRKSTKKQKRNDGTASAFITNGEYDAGTGPLPHDAEDGFDRRIKHGLPDGPEVEYKTQDELLRRKLQPTGEFAGILEIYTDGASKGNGQLGAYAGFGIWFGPNHPKNEHGPLAGERQTNQRAELTAIQRAVDIAPIDRTAMIYTDSHYSVKCLTDWFRSWEAKGWKNSAGRPVENRDLIEPILKRIREREDAGAKTHFVWVKAHNGNNGNEEADRLANMGAEEKRQEIEMENMFNEATKTEEFDD